VSEKAAGTITLEASTVGKGEQAKEFLVARFEPPLPQGTGYRKDVDGYYPSKLLQTDDGETTGVIYERGIFGWAKDEREEAFLKYWQKQGKRLGYVVESDTVHHSEEAPTEPTQAR
jgi:hypothetical protein